MLRERLPRDRRDWLLTIGVALMALGFIAIALGWNGSAGGNARDLRLQLPYVISGGLAGLALVVSGSALILVQAFRRDHDRVSAEIAELRDQLLAAGGASTGDLSVPRGLDDTQSIPLGEGLVVAGKTSYHRPDCRLASRRGEAEVLPVAAAKARGLAPCRVCDPDAA